MLLLCVVSCLNIDCFFECSSAVVLELNTERGKHKKSVSKRTSETVEKELEDKLHV